MYIGTIFQGLQLIRTRQDASGLGVGAWTDADVPCCGGLLGKWGHFCTMFDHRNMNLLHQLQYLNLLLRTGYGDIIYIYYILYIILYYIVLYYIILYYNYILYIYNIILYYIIL